MAIGTHIYTRWKRAAAALGFVVRSSATSDVTADPTLTSGSGAPSAAEPNGSVYLRTDGSTYVRTGGAWVLLQSDGRAGLLATAAVFQSIEQTGNGSEQSIAHGFGAVPTLAFAIPTELTGGAYDVAYGTHTSTNVLVTVTSGEKYRIIAIK